MKQPQTSLSEDGLKAKAMIDRQAKLDKLPGEGWTRKVPPRNGVAWQRGDQYLNSNGDPIDAPEEFKKGDREIVQESVDSAVEEMSDSDIAKLQIQIDGEITATAARLGMSGDSKFLDQYSDDELKRYLSANSINVKKTTKRPGLLTLVAESLNPKEPEKPEPAKVDTKPEPEAEDEGKKEK